MVSREDAIALADFRHPPEEMDNGGEVLARVDDVFHTEESDATVEFLPPTLATEISPAEEGGTNRVIGRLDVNVYAHKKTLAQGMMDLALLSANANQLRYVLDMGSSHPYFYPSSVLIATSLALQIAVGVGLILISQYNIKKEGQLDRANRINNFTMIGIFLITIINVFISAFSISMDVADSAPASPVRITDASDADGAITEPSI